MALIADLSGWVVAALVACTMVLPTLARGRLAVVGVRWARPRSVWLGTHYRVGFAIGAVCLLHAVLAMSAGRLPATPLGEAGIWIASGGLFLVLAQVAIGGKLREGGGRSRLLRPVHVLIFAALVAAGIVHILLNGSAVPFPGGL